MWPEEELKVPQKQSKGARPWLAEGLAPAATPNLSQSCVGVGLCDGPRASVTVETRSNASPTIAPDIRNPALESDSDDSSDRLRSTRKTVVHRPAYHGQNPAPVLGRAYWDRDRPGFSALCLRLRTHIRSWSPSNLYKRRTRLRFISHSSRRSNSQIHI